MAELLPDAEDIERSLAQLLGLEIDEETRSGAEFIGIPAEEYRASLVKEHRAKLKWLRQRQSPPHCLDCGSTYLVNMSAWTGGQSSIEHPQCGGQLHLTAIAHASQGRYRMFNGEGLELFPSTEKSEDDS